MSDELFNLINELKRTNNQKIITEISFLKMCLMQNKKEEKNIDKIETKNNSKDNRNPYNYRRKNKMKKKKKIKV